MIDLASVDLDGDNVEEVLVSWLIGVSNGIAEEWRTRGAQRWAGEPRYDSGEFTASTATQRINGHATSRRHTTKK
jgi:hypothetical protein